MLWVIGQLWYNGTKNVGSLKKRAFDIGLGTILRDFCCGVTAFVTNPKYSHMPGNQGGPIGRLQEQEAVEDDIEAAQTTRKSGNDGMARTASPDGRDEPDRLF